MCIKTLLPAAIKEQTVKVSQFQRACKEHRVILWISAIGNFNIISRLAAPATSGQPKFPVAIYGCFSGAFHSSSHLLLRTSLSIVNLYMYYLVLWRGAGLSAGPQKFISLCSLLVAVGEDSEIWKLYGIKRKRLIEFMLITWDLEEKVFCCNHPSS